MRAKYDIERIRRWNLIERNLVVASKKDRNRRAPQQLQKEKVEPLKVKFDLRFMSTNIDELIAGINDITDEAYGKALDALYSEVEYLFRERTVLKNILNKTSGITTGNDKHFENDLQDIMIRYKSRLIAVEKTCELIKRLVEKNP